MRYVKPDGVIEIYKSKDGKPPRCRFLEDVRFKVPTPWTYFPFTDTGRVKYLCKIAESCSHFNFLLHYKFGFHIKTQFTKQYHEP